MNAGDEYEFFHLLYTLQGNWFVQVYICFLQLIDGNSCHQANNHACDYPAHYLVSFALGKIVYWSLVRESDFGLESLLFVELYRLEIISGNLTLVLAWEEK
jgi:hypothetical protein